MENLKNPADGANLGIYSVQKVELGGTNVKTVLAAKQVGKGTTRMERYATDLTLSFWVLFLFPFMVIFQFSYLLPCTTVPTSLQA